MHDAAAIDNAVDGLGDGGFLSAEFAREIFLQRVNISGAQTGKDGGGGALFVFGSKVILDQTRIDGCSAGIRGGGGILLDGGAEADLYEGVLSDNIARGGFGGHIRVTASRLNIFGASKEFKLKNVPPVRPMFPNDHPLSGTQGTTTMTNGTALSGGGIFCSSAKFPKLGVLIEPGTAISYSSATGRGNSEGGGGLAAAFCDVILEGALFTNNSAAHGNGGAALLGNGVEFTANEGAVFKNNRASDSGGALACAECKSVLLAGGTRFEGNEAHVNGGAISIVKPGSSDPTNSSGSVFRSNTAETGNGGAVYIVQGTEETGTWQSSAKDVFEENTALEGSGGAFFAVGTKALFAEGASCAKNRAMKGGGGCIMWEPLAETANSSLWDSRKPEHHAQSFFEDNSAAFGNDKATPPVSLRPIVDANVNISAKVDGGSLEPAPSVEILDLYGQVVLGAFAGAVSIEAKRTEEATDVTIYGGVKSLSNASEGVARFESLGLRGKPRSGPHGLSFSASIQVGRGASSLNTARDVDSTSAAAAASGPTFIEAWVGDCPVEKYFFAGGCHLCPDRSKIVNFTMRNGSRNGPAGYACDCDEGFHNKELAGSSEINCVPCAKGETSNGTACVPCAPGTYKNVEGSAPCQSCRVGTLQLRERRYL